MSYQILKNSDTILRPGIKQLAVGHGVWREYTEKGDSPGKILGSTIQTVFVECGYEKLTVKIPMSSPFKEDEEFADGGIEVLFKGLSLNPYVNKNTRQLALSAIAESVEIVQKQAPTPAKATS
jgi:hypothetical protein